MMFKDNIIDNQHKFINICFNQHIPDSLIAQLAEWVFCDSKVAGSNPTEVNFIFWKGHIWLLFGDFYSIFKSFMLDTQKVMYVKPIH